MYEIIMWHRYIPEPIWWGVSGLLVLGGTAVIVGGVIGFLLKERDTKEK